MTATQERLIARARERCGAEIEPCAGRSWEECFTKLPGGEQIFWFNSTDGNTHIERAGKPGEEVQA